MRHNKVFSMVMFLGLSLSVVCGVYSQTAAVAKDEPQSVTIEAGIDRGTMTNYPDPWEFENFTQLTFDKAGIHYRYKGVDGSPRPWEGLETWQRSRGSQLVSNSVFWLRFVYKGGSSNLYRVRNESDLQKAVTLLRKYAAKKQKPCLPDDHQCF